MQLAAVLFVVEVIKVLHSVVALSYAKAGLLTFCRHSLPVSTRIIH